MDPVRMSEPSAVRKRSRNGLSGMGRMRKQPTSSASVVAVVPSRPWISITPDCAGMT